MELARQILAVVFVFALLASALWALRRGSASLGIRLTRPGSPRVRPLESMDRVTLTPQHSLHLVRACGREWLLATHPQGCTVISDGQSKGAAA